MQENPTTEESWRPVEVYGTTLLISDLGRVRFASGRDKKLTIGDRGYYVTGVKTGKRGRGGRWFWSAVYVHHLVLEAFQGPRPPGMECRHLDGDKLNNRNDNLKWGTSKENSEDIKRHGRTIVFPPRHGEHNPKAILDRAKARVVCHLAMRKRLTMKKIGGWFGVSAANVASIKYGQNWSRDTEDIRQ